MNPNFLLHDSLGISLGLVLYLPVLLCPGYVTGFALDLFRFRQRTLVVQWVMGGTFSAVVSPTLFFLVYRFSSFAIAAGVLAALTLASMSIFASEIRKKKLTVTGRFILPALIFTALWLLLSISVLIDLQIGDRLYFSNNAYDLTTRVAVVDAITRTGVPPVNPSYFPGHAVKLDFLYYYWYILASLVETLGGSLVGPHHAMIASICWAGILLFSSMAVYIRLREQDPSRGIWRKATHALQLFAVSGLDFLMVMMIASAFKFQLGDLPFKGNTEGWNMPIMSWMNALAWVPHHLTAMVACMIALAFLLYGVGEKGVRGFAYSLMAGIAFSSALGLSFWVMVIFGMFWVVYGMVIAISRDYRRFLHMILAGVIGVVLASPFLLGIFTSGGSSAGGRFPLAFYIRPFLIGDLMDEFSPVVVNLVNLASLPINYLFEFGLFFILALLWVQRIYKNSREANPFHRAETVLVIVSLLALSFLRSNLIAINDFGIRGWLPMQFVLVVWSADVLSLLPGLKWRITPRAFLAIKTPRAFGLLAAVMFIVGLSTTALELFSLRSWSLLVDAGYVRVPNELSPDQHLGERTYAARLAYAFVREELPLDAMIQSNPQDFLDRPSGLYASRPMAISDRSAYGVSPEEFNHLVNEVSPIFTRPAGNWAAIDGICTGYSIDFLVIKETDPLWGSLPVLNTARPALYKNNYYTIYPCGS